MKALFKNSSLAAFFLALMGAVMLAGGTGTEFSGIEATLVDWMEGGLGRVLAILFFGIGLAVGLARQNLFAAVTGLAAALIVSLGPTIITGIVTASVLAV